VVQGKFGADDFRTAINELLTLKHTGHCSLTLPCTIVTMMNSLHQSMLKGSRRRLRPLWSSSNYQNSAKNTRKRQEQIY
jgi:hypothetical protein